MKRIILVALLMICLTLVGASYAVKMIVTAGERSNVSFIRPGHSSYDDLNARYLTGRMLEIGELIPGAGVQVTERSGSAAHSFTTDARGRVEFSASAGDQVLVRNPMYQSHRFTLPDDSPAGMIAKVDLARYPISTNYMRFQIVEGNSPKVEYFGNMEDMPYSSAFLPASSIYLRRTSGGGSGSYIQTSDDQGWCPVAVVVPGSSVTVRKDGYGVYSFNLPTSVSDYVASPLIARISLKKLGIPPIRPTAPGVIPRL